MSQNIVYCCICRQALPIEKRYGLVATCCCRECHDEFTWRDVLANQQLPYRPRNQPNAEPGERSGE